MAPNITGWTGAYDLVGPATKGGHDVVHGWVHTLTLCTPCTPCATSSTVALPPCGRRCIAAIAAAIAATIVVTIVVAMVVVIASVSVG
jgi:hypothetical protein